MLGSDSGNSGVLTNKGFTHSKQEIMNKPENFSSKGKSLPPVLSKHGEDSFDAPLVCWLFLFSTIGFTLFESLQSFFSTGRIWPVIFILAVFLLLGNSYRKMKQRKHWAVFLESCAPIRN